MIKMARLRCVLFTHLLAAALVASGCQAAGQQGAAGAAAEATAQSQPLWTYQAKTAFGAQPQQGSGLGGLPAGAHHMPAPYSLMDIFASHLNGGQRQGLTSGGLGGPLMSILPIVLIAAGGFLLLLPFLSMMMASPFSGFAQGGQFGPYGQFAAMSRKRSLSDEGSALPKPQQPLGAANLGSKNLHDLVESVSATIQQLARRYETNQVSFGSQTKPGKESELSTLASSSSSTTNNKI